MDGRIEPDQGQKVCSFEKKKKELIEQIKTGTESSRFDLELYKIIKNIVKMKNKCRKILISI